MDDQTRGGHPVAVLSHASWATRFGSDERILNQTTLVNGVTLTIIGIAPEGFAGVTMGSMPDLYIPISMHESLNSTWKRLDNRRSYRVYLMARVKPGVAKAQAQSAMNVLHRGIINEVDAPLQKGASDNYMGKRLRNTRPGAQGMANG